MRTAKHYRDEAERCRRLAKGQTDKTWAQLMEIAREYEAKAQAVDDEQL